MTPAEASLTNLLNSVSTYLADQLRQAGYLIYWHEQDAVETASGWWPAYSVNQAAYAADATFAAQLAAATGLITLRGPLPANPAFVARPTNDGTVEGQSVVHVPGFAVELSDPTPVRPVELGTRLWQRARHLIVFGFARTWQEQATLSDALAQWFDAYTVIPVQDHDAGTLVAVGNIDIVDPTVISDIVVDDAEVETYSVELHARVEYIA